MKPILFSPPMILSILQGKKSQTRRILKEQNIRIHPIEGWPGSSTGEVKCPYGKVGDVLWVRESFRVNSWFPDDGEMSFRYEADETVTEAISFEDDEPFNKYWVQSCDDLASAGYEIQPDECYRDFDVTDLRLRPNIFMPSFLCRLFLKIKSIRVEKLHDISEKDSKKEGVATEKFVSKIFKSFDGYKNYYVQDADDITCRTAKESFRSLWMKINGSKSWYENPWLWVVEFERIEKP